MNFIDFFHDYNFVEISEIEKINKWNNEALNSFIRDTQEINAKESAGSNEKFSFSANEQLSSGKNPCENYACRLKEIEKLATFATLYADDVFIYYPFDNYKIRREWDSHSKRSLINDIKIIRELLPLIEKGIIKFCSGASFLCNSCREKIILEFSEIVEFIVEQVESNTTFSFNGIHEYKNGDEAALFSIVGNPEIFGHDSVKHLLSGEKIIKYYSKEKQ